MPTVYLWEYWWSCVPFCYTLEEVKVCLKSTKFIWMKAFEPFLRIFTNPCFPFYDWSSFRVLSIFFLHNFSLLQFHWKNTEMIYNNCMNTVREKEALLHHEAVETSTTQNTKFTRITKCTFIRTTTLHSTTLTALVESSYFPGTCHITTQQPHYTSIVTFNVLYFHWKPSQDASYISEFMSLYLACIND